MKVKTSEKTYVQNMPFMCDLKNKNSLIYLFTLYQKKHQKKKLKAYDIKYRGYINIKLNINNLLEFNDKQFHVIYIDYNY